MWCSPVKRGYDSAAVRCQKDAVRAETSVREGSEYDDCCSVGSAAMRCGLSLSLSLSGRTRCRCLLAWLCLTEREREGGRGREGGGEEPGCWCAEQTEAASLLIPPFITSTRKKYYNWSIPILYRRKNPRAACKFLSSALVWCSLRFVQG